MEEPAVILAMPRSGSSMTAGIFAIHGFWEGRCRTPDDLNPKGYHENLDIKDILIRRYGRLAQGTEPAAGGSGFRDEILGLKPKSPWMVKHSAMYRRAWDEFNPKFVCVRRKVSGIIGSNKKTGFLGTKDEYMMMEIIDAHHREMNLSGGVSVFVDRLIAGDYSSIENALEHCGVTPNRRKIADFVDPALWNRWSA